MDTHDINGNNNQNNDGQKPMPVRPNFNQGQQTRPTPVRPNFNQGQQNTQSKPTPVRPDFNNQTVNNVDSTSSVRQQYLKQAEQEKQERIQQAQESKQQEQEARQQEQASVPVQKVNIVDEQKSYNEQEEFDNFNSKTINNSAFEDKSKKDKQTKVKVEKTPEQKKKQKMIIIGSASGVAVLLIGLIVFKCLTKNSNQHITVVANETVGIVTQASDEVFVPVVDSKVSDYADESQSVNIEVVEQSKEKPLPFQQYTAFNTVVNTKTASDAEYTDHDAAIYIRLSQVVTGYDDVCDYIKEYNESGDTLINFPDKDAYYAGSNGAELVMYEIEVLFPSNFPTPASEGVIYIVPSLETSLYGTATEIDNDDITDDPSNYIVVDNNIYSINKLTSITVKKQRINVGEPILYRYVASVPSGASVDSYKVHTVFDLESNGNEVSDIYFDGIDIPKLEYNTIILDDTAVEHSFE